MGAGNAPVSSPAGQATPAPGLLHVEVVYAPAGAAVDLTRLALPEGATLAEALEASGVLVRHGLSLERTPAGIWGRRARADTRLRVGDRVELYRPLQCDPKEARRQRQRRQAPGRSRRGSAAPAAPRA